MWYGIKFEIIKTILKRYKEHFRDFEDGSNESNFVKNLLDNDHSVSPIKDITEILHVTNKGAHISTLKKFHIYVETKKK